MQVGVIEVGLSERITEHVRGEHILAALCGIEPEHVRRCGRSGCDYYDDERATCALLRFDVANRLEPGAVRWFVEHRTADTPETTLDPSLAMRCASL